MRLVHEPRGAFWSAVAERERRHRFRADETHSKISPVSHGRKRRGAALPAAVQDASGVLRPSNRAERFGAPAPLALWAGCAARPIAYFTFFTTSISMDSRPGHEFEAEIL
jgi:hypothetical protein